MRRENFRGTLLSNLQVKNLEPAFPIASDWSVDTQIFGPTKGKIIQLSQEDIVNLTSMYHQLYPEFGGQSCDVGMQVPPSARQYRNLDLVCAIYGSQNTAATSHRM